MTLDYVSIERRDGIAVVRFDRKANLNAFNEKLVLELTEAARSFHDDLETHAVVFAGAPTASRPVSTSRRRTAGRARPTISGAGSRLWRRAPMQGLGGDAADHHRGDGEAGRRRRRGHRAGLRLAGARPHRLSLRARGQDRLEPAMGRPAPVHHPGRSPAPSAFASCARRCPRRQALDWGLVDELADDGKTVEKALEMAEVCFDASAHRAHGEGGRQCHRGGVHAATSFADADQSQLTASFHRGGGGAHVLPQQEVEGSPWAEEVRLTTSMAARSPPTSPCRAQYARVRNCVAARGLQHQPAHPLGSRRLRRRRVRRPGAECHWRQEPGCYAAYTDEGPRQGASSAHRLDTDQFTKDLGDVVASLRARKDCTGKVGVMDFASAASSPIESATRWAIEAAVSYYGVEIDKYLDEADRLRLPDPDDFAETDPHAPEATVAAIKARMGGWEQRRDPPLPGHRARL